MLQTLGPFKPVLLAALFLAINQGLVGSILSVRLAEMQASAQMAGLMTTAYFIGHVLGSRLGHRLLGRTGHIRAFAGMMAIGAISALLIPVIPEPLAWIAIRLAAGISLVLGFLVLESWLNMQTSNENRGSVFGVYITVVYVGMTAGQVMLGFVDAMSFQAFSITAMMLMLAILPMTMTSRAQPDLPADARLRLTDLVRLSPVGFAACAASGALTGAIFGLFPYYASGAGLDISGIAIFMSATVGGGLLLNWPLGKLSDRVDRRWVIALAGIAIAASSAVLALSGTGLAVLVSAGGLLGGATAVLYSLGVAHTNDFSGSIDPIAVGGGLLLAFGLGAIAGPVVASMMMDLLLAAALFLFTGMAGAGLAGLALFRMVVRQAAASVDKVDFVPLSSTAGPAMGVDPLSVAAEAADQLAAAEPVT